MRLIHDEQPDAPLQQRQELLPELRVRQPLRRHHEQVEFVAGERGLNLAPLLHVLAVHRRRAHAEPFCGQELVAHEREQRADEQRRSRAGLAKNFCREEIDDALAPAGALDDEEPLPPIGDVVNRLPLAVAESGPRPNHLLQERVSSRLVHDR